MRISKILLTLVFSTLVYTSAMAGDVVKDDLGTHASAAKTVESLLHGQVAGARVWSMDSSPMSAQGVSIRGVNSIRGNSQPVYVVDGTVLNSSNVRNINPLWQYADAAFVSPVSVLSFMTPDDIESIEVIKNASAAALYGSKGANGVVIINTRRLEQEKMKTVWDSDVDVSVPMLKGFSTPSVSHNHRIMLGSMKDRTGYTLSAYFRDDKHLLPNTGSIKGGLRTTFETRANSVVWFGLNSHLAVGQTSQAAATACEDLGYVPVILTDELSCVASQAGAFLSAIARTKQHEKRSLAFIAGGETVVHVTGTGLGGRNQELALAAAVGLDGLMDTAVFSVGSDGTDGPTDAAGGYVDQDTKKLLDSLGIDIAKVLRNNDAYHVLEKADGLIKTGPTGTNVNDVSVLLIRR